MIIASGTFLLKQNGILAKNVSITFKLSENRRN